MDEQQSQMAEIEISYRGNSPSTWKAKINESKEVANLFRAVWNRDHLEIQEEFHVIYLNRGHHILGWRKVSSGGMTGTVADPRLILGIALKCGAVSLIMCHNHPSGNLRPSKADEELTLKIKEAGRVMDIKVLDHIIITDEGYFSFADEGMM